MTAPCKDCKDRWFDLETGKRCHTTCEKYKLFKEQNEQANQNRLRYYDAKHRTPAFEREIRNCRKR